MEDCSGNRLENNSVDFALPQTPDSFDIVINEILFDPGYLGTEFIEIYNHSNKVLNLDDIRFAIRENYSGDLNNITVLQTEGYLLFPRSYFAITNNKSNLESEYIIKDKFTVYKNKLPQLSDNEGTLVLADKNLEIIDVVYYSQMYHHPLLEKTEGVSLERLDTEAPSLKKENWHSASSTSGFGTPGYINSQTNAEGDDNSEIIIKPEVFSPDNDGFDDLLAININSSTEGSMASISIYSSRGIPVRYLANNTFLGIQNTFFWDGLNGKGELQAFGIYMIFIQIHNKSGYVKEYKKSCVLAGYLNH